MRFKNPVEYDEISWAGPLAMEHLGSFAKASAASWSVSSNLRIQVSKLPWKVVIKIAGQH